MKKKKELKIIGWREWLNLPDLGVKKIKCKIDTGARSSALHAFDMEFFKKGRKEFVRFSIHPEQRNDKLSKKCTSQILEYRSVRSSNGQTEKRPVILTSIKLFDEIWETEITLTNRDQMGFRMLLGRQSFKNKFLVNVGKSYLGNKK